MIKRLKRELKHSLKNKEVIDIVVIGSSVKGKLKPRDIDLIVILKNRAQEAKEIIYSLRKQKYHAEPLFAENIFSDEEMLKTIITEGISLKHNKILKKIKPLLIFSYSLCY